MELIGYIEEYGATKAVQLVGTGYQPAEELQRLEIIDDDNRRGKIWAKLVAIEQPLFDPADV